MVTKLTGLSVSAIILLLATFFQVGDTSLEPNYACPGKELKAFCYDFSKSGRTCYTQPNKIGGKLCDTVWEEIPELIPEVPEVPKAPEELKQISISSNKIHCNNKGCF